MTWMHVHRGMLAHSHIRDEGTSALQARLLLVSTPAERVTDPSRFCRHVSTFILLFYASYVPIAEFMSAASLIREPRRLSGILRRSRCRRWRYPHMRLASVEVGC